MQKRTRHQQKRQISRKLWLKLHEKSKNDRGFIAGSLFLKIKKYELKKQKIARSAHKFRKAEYKNIGKIILPEKIDFADNIHSILEIKRQVDRCIDGFKKRIRSRVRLDHSSIKNVSVGGLLYLVGQISKISEVINTGLKYNKKLGLNKNNDKIKYLFYKIGYWAYFGIRRAPYKMHNTEIRDSYFLEIHSSNEWKPTLLNKLKVFVDEETDFFQGDYKKIYQFDDIIKEAMGNSLEHAYPKDFDEFGKIPKKWWVCGHYGKKEKCLDLVFYDYGVGIRESMKNNLGEEAEIRMFDKIKDRMMSDADLIELAVSGDLSKYKNYKERDRGKGLKRFKNFAKTCGYDCELVIVSNKGKYKFSYNHNMEQEKVSKEKLEREIDGMFIKWRIKL